MAGYSYAPNRRPDDADLAAIEAACRDYAEAWYQADEDRMLGCLHPELDKRGLVRRLIDERAELFLANLTSSSTMGQLTGAGVGQADPEERRIEITILAAMHHLAAAQVETRGMTDLLHLMKFPAGWKIVHSVWTLDDGVIANARTDA